MGCVASVPEDTVGIVECGGRFSRLLPPGLHCITPGFAALVGLVNCHERNCSLSLELNTKEFALVRLKVHAQYKVRDELMGELIENNSNAYKAYYTVNDNPEPKLLEYIEGNLRGQIRSTGLAQILGKEDSIAKLLQEEADAELHQYGFTVFHVGVTDLVSDHVPAPPAPESAAEQWDDCDVPSDAGTVLATEMFLDQCIYATLERQCSDRGLQLVSALQIVKMQRKFGRDPAKRILVITKSGPAEGPTKGPIKVEMHSFKRETEEEVATRSVFKKKPTPKTEETLSLEKDDAEYTLIRTYPLLLLKNVVVRDGMFVLSFEDKTPDLCISSLNARQVSAFVDEAIKTCQEASMSATPLVPTTAKRPSVSEPLPPPPPSQLPPASAGSKKGAFGATATAMERNKKMLQERGEKLRDVGDKSEEMAGQAADFLAAVRRMRQQQAEKKWYEL